MFLQCWLNGILSTLVSLLLLFRTLDGSNAWARQLHKIAPWLPLPPAVGLRGQETTTQQKTQFGGETMDQSTSTREKELSSVTDSSSNGQWQTGGTESSAIGQGGMLEVSLADVRIDSFDDRLEENIDWRA